MDFNKFTEKSQEAVGQAQALATRHGQQQVEVEHLFLALLEQEGGLAEKILSRVDVDAGQLKQNVENEIASLPSVQDCSSHADRALCCTASDSCSVAVGRSTSSPLRESSGR